MTEELKACPFCGEKAIYTSVDGFKAEFSSGNIIKTTWCKCSECAPGEIVHTVEHWQSRPIETAAYVKGLLRALDIACKDREHYEITKRESAEFPMSQLIAEIKAAIQEAQS